MALPVTVYRWDDVGAPQIVDGKPSEYMNVLKKCLVEGYGSKESLGWTVVDDIASPPFLSLRNNISLGGSGGVAVFSALDDVGGTNIKAFGCQDYASKDSQSRKSYYFPITRYSTGQYLNNKWLIIGTATAFYFFCYSDYIYNSGSNRANTLVPNACFIGDMKSLYPNDPAKFIAFSGAKNTINHTWTQTIIYSLSESSPLNIMLINQLDGTDASQPASLFSVCGYYYHVRGNHDGPANITALFPIYICMGNSFLNDSSPYQNNNFPYLRAILPGAFVANSPGYRGEAMPVIKELDGVSYYLLPSANSNTGCCWINLEEW
ncbi:conserved hypothetical protein [Pseudoalteromonas sp. 3J6]|uniref:hypothetical protein n=1 Tax=Pseudoalteromonas sp. 3J6 TaxID=649161 RepID=UPI0017742FA1|nr:hypothetical protein [Pseudoalteromonas sp. 3J6]CAD2225000.1 conserved hypothetical protein [Pseudoalteromonas sp. 3J6]